MRSFFSHNKRDIGLARPLGAQLFLAGIDVRFDEWEIQAGESIPGKLDEGLAGFDAFVLLWSTNASKSKWVRKELQSAIMRYVEDPAVKIVPCLLDDTPLPALIADIKAVDFSDPGRGTDELLDALTGHGTRRGRLLAIQSVLLDLDVSWITHPALPPLFCCPRCGSDGSLVPWQQIDEHRDDIYGGMRCEECGWSDGGEL